MVIDTPTLLARLLLALVIGAAFGIDRSLQGEAAGMRTYALVAFGSALLTAVLSYGFSAFAHQAGVQLDPGRAVSQIVVGIGFLGGGAIVVQGGIRRGVTTAAGIWLMAGIGIAAGLGMYAAALIAGALGLFVLVPLRFVEERYFRHVRSVMLVRMQPRAGQLDELLRLAKEAGIEVRATHLSHDEGLDAVELELAHDMRSDLPALVSRLQQVAGVRQVALRRL